MVTKNKDKIAMKEYIAVIQAGGKGSRMLEYTKDEIPKPMLLLNGKPMLQWQIEEVASYGVKEFVIIIGHLGEKIEKYFGDGKKYSVHISYIREKEPLGSAGAMYYLKKLINTENFILIFGDVMFTLDWNRMKAFHESTQASATLLVHPNGHPYDSDLLILNKENQVTNIDSKNNIRNYWYNNIVNAGIYIFKSEVLSKIDCVKKRDLEKDIIVPLIKEGKVYGYRTPEYVKDAGTPKRYQSVCREQKEGLWKKKCLSNKQKCIFLDRDGTVNKYNGLISRDEQLELENSVAEAVKKINESGYLAIIITNQPVVARGMCSIEDVEYIHKKLQTLLGEQGVYVDDIAFCPHHPDKGYPEENPIYKIKCECRKPSIGMIDCMAKKYNIDLKNSWIIGDTTIDIQTGKNAGMNTALLLTGEAGNDKKYHVQQDITSRTLLEAVETILVMEKSE